MAVQQVLNTDSLDVGRSKWNSNDLELEASITALQNQDTSTAGIISALQATDTAFSQTHTVLENMIEANTAIITETTIALRMQTVTLTNINQYQNAAWGWEFELSSFLGTRILRNGSVEVAVNGINYSSPDNQSDYVTHSDFHISTTKVYFHDIAHNGSLDLVNTDTVHIRFQKAQA